jgi:hypothetical protein
LLKGTLFPCSRPVVQADAVEKHLSIGVHLGSDGNLYLAGFDGSSWNWVSLSNGGVSLSGSPTAIPYPASDGTVHQHSFVLGSDGNLYTAYYDGSWHWRVRSLLCAASVGFSVVFLSS